MKLTREIVNEISKIKNEPDFMREFRIRSFECFEMIFLHSMLFLVVSVVPLVNPTLETHTINIKHK